MDPPKLPPPTCELLLRSPRFGILSLFAGKLNHSGNLSVENRHVLMRRSQQMLRAHIVIFAACPMMGFIITPAHGSPDTGEHPLHFFLFQKFLHRSSLIRGQAPLVESALNTIIYTFFLILSSMNYELKNPSKSEVEITITVAPADYQKNLEAAAVRLSERAAIKGFRPGKAPYEMVKEQLGAIKILEEALQSIVEGNYFEAVQKEKLSTVGHPEIVIEKMAPDNDLIFKAKAALFPSVKLAALEKIKVSAKGGSAFGGKKEAGEEEINKVMEDLKKMRAKEVAKNGVADKENKIVVDLDMFIDKVPVEGGGAKNHQVYLSEPHYIPGFAEQLIGLKVGDDKEFALKFPAEHYQKHLAGKNVDMKVKVKDVFELQYPVIDDEFAKGLGQKDLSTMKGLLKDNLTKEANQKEDQRVEVAILEELIGSSEFGEIPKILIDSEKKKMFHELKHGLQQQSIEMEKYLKDLKKTEEEIFKDFTESAEKRVKAALISRELALQNNIKVEPKEVEEEIETIAHAYNHDPKVEENLNRPEVKDTIAVTIQNRKVMQWLKERLLK